MLRSVTARDLAFWCAYEEVEGPIGYGPLGRIAAWMGWTQCDASKVIIDDVMADLEAWMDPAAGDELDVVDDEDAPETAAEDQEARRKAVEWKLMQMLGHPELKAISQEMVED